MQRGVYFIIEEPFRGYVKIGKTKNIKGRLQTLQTGHPNKLSIYRFIKSENNAELEVQLHKRFNDKRIRGEWFKLNLEEIDNIADPAGDKFVISKYWLELSLYFQNLEQRRLSDYCRQQCLLIWSDIEKDYKETPAKYSAAPIPAFPQCKNIRFITLRTDKDNPTELYNAMGKILRSSMFDIKAHYFSLELDNGLPIIHLLVFSDSKRFDITKIGKFWPLFECDKPIDKTGADFYKRLIRELPSQATKDYCSKYRISQSNI